MYCPIRTGNEIFHVYTGIFLPRTFPEVEVLIPDEHSLNSENTSILVLVPWSPREILRSSLHGEGWIRDPLLISVLRRVILRCCGILWKMIVRIVLFLILSNSNPLDCLVVVA